MRIAFITTIALLTLGSCSKEIKLDPLSFDVQADSSSYNAGSVAKFQFTGKPDNISFFSGETGNRHQYINRVEAAGLSQLIFKSAMNSGMQPNTLKLMVSTNFEGGLTAASDPAIISKASWTDISSRVTWATSSTAVESGIIDLTDFATAGKPVFIAFKYAAEAGSIQNKWTITALSLRNLLSDGTSYLQAAMPTVALANNYGVSSNLPGWANGTVANTIKWTLNATNLVITGATSAGSATTATEAWAITGPINLKSVTPDIGLSVQTMNGSEASFNYIYSVPGTYEAVFEASNVNRDLMKKIEKKLSVTVK